MNLFRTTIENLEGEYMPIDFELGWVLNPNWCVKNCKVWTT